MPSKPTSKAHSLVDDELTASSQITSTSPKKRKSRPAVDTDSSNVEIIESPASLAKNFSDVWNIFYRVLTTLIILCASTALDTILTEGAFSPTVTFGSAKRTVVKTAKATYSDVVKTKLALSVFSIWIEDFKGGSPADCIIPPTSKDEHALSELTDSDDNLPDVSQCVMV
ncbi:hypothetical protein L208DRAFT_1376785 [Tricholoma matsutake]|nr:hypothetical protein L208DRAFT_1376785 [Tricholoma matsutake 945]